MIDRQCDKKSQLDSSHHYRLWERMGHGHANALVGWTLQGNVAAPRAHGLSPAVQRGENEDR